MSDAKSLTSSHDRRGRLLIRGVLYDGRMERGREGAVYFCMTASGSPNMCSWDLADSTQIVPLALVENLGVDRAIGG